MARKEPSMLALSRQRDETIMIGDEVEITVVDIRGDKVRLGISAPRSIQVHRKEVFEAIKRENAEAANIGVSDLTSADRDLKRKSPDRGSNARPARPPLEPHADPRQSNRLDGS